eukprot:Skav215557  [mRNA]  locus=scaffold3091:244832:254443:+ [translate_table: standard]
MHGCQLQPAIGRIHQVQGLQKAKSFEGASATTMEVADICSEAKELVAACQSSSILVMLACLYGLRACLSHHLHHNPENAKYSFEGMLRLFT